MSRDFASEACEIIVPRSDLREDCLDRLRWHLQTLPRMGLEESPPSHASLRKEIEEFANAMRRAHVKFSTLSPWSKAVLFGEHGIKTPPVPPAEVFDSLSARALRRADILFDGRGIPKHRTGGPGLDHRVLASAEVAFLLMTEFSERQPNKTTGGPFHKLAQLIAEASFGLVEPPVERACDKVLHYRATFLSEPQT